MRVCKTKNTNVTVFTKKTIYLRIMHYIEDETKYNFVLMGENESINSFLNRVEKICNEKIDILFVNTIQTSLNDIPHYFRFNPKSKMILTVHTTNHWLKYKFALGIRNIFKTIDANLSLYFIRKKVLPKFDAINVIYYPLKSYIKQNTEYKKPIFTIPYAYSEEKTSGISKDGKIRIVIPGRVEEYRRDYTLALDVFEKLFKKFGTKIVLYLAGRPYEVHGTRIIEKCERLKENGYNIIFFKEFIPEKEYHKILLESDLIFSPLKTEKIAPNGIKEIYGTTEASTVPFESIQHSKPLIVPKDFKVINELKSSTLQYDSAEELENIITELIKDKDKLEKLEKEAYKNSKHFSLDLLQEYFENDILKTL
jgi:hypothetical protein